MFKFYIGTVICWMIIIWCSTKLCKDKIIENGWLNTAKKLDMTPFGALFCISAIPFFRFLVFIVIIYMACVSKDKYDQDMRN